ncbi:MAG: T9SS type A sorting domain-containing protein, partial [Bacteroidales bacterium]|nr:T9SS type A sorting domain-containing protein [Bacteroidales bacterium]
GTYAYTVVKDGYSTGTGNVTVVDQDVLVDVTLNEIVLSGNIMKLHDVVAEAGSTIVIEMEIINEDQFVAWQFDIPLPEGFDYVAGSAALTDRATNHQIHANVLPSTNLFRSLSISFTNDFFLGNSGVVATYEITTPDEPGVYDFVLVDAIISNIQAQDIITGTEDASVTLEGAIEEYTVTFIITDQYENEIDDAVVTLGDVTNPAGDYIFTVEPGTYSYSIEKIGFLLETGDVTVVDQDVTVTVIMIVDGINELQSNFTITSIYPNPAKESTRFEFTLNKRSNVAIDITNILGQKVQTVNSGTFDAGEQYIIINTKSLSSGMYFLIVRTDNYKTTSKFIVE